VEQQTENNSIWSNLKKLYALKPVRCNTLILCTTWSTGAFTFYFVEFYTKFVPTQNIYLLQIIIGCADIVSSATLSIMLTKVRAKTSLLYILSTMAVASLTLYLSVGLTGYADFERGVDHIDLGLSLIFAGLVFVIRIFAHNLVSLSYYLNTSLTPPLLLSSVFALTNITCRSATILVPFVAELVSNPSILVTVNSTLTLIAVMFLKTDTRKL